MYYLLNKNNVFNIKQKFQPNIVLRCINKYCDFYICSDDKKSTNKNSLLQKERKKNIKDNI